MNPIEQFWKQLRAMGFKNEVFKTLNHVVDRLCETICRLSHDVVKSVNCRQWRGHSKAKDLYVASSEYVVQIPQLSVKGLFFAGLVGRGL